MIETPKSLTAIVHVRFNYKDNEKNPKGPSDKTIREGELETLNTLMDQASELPLDLQEMLVRFGSFLKSHSGDGRAEP